MIITTKYDIGQAVWEIGKYDTKPKKCSECGHDFSFVRYRVLPKNYITNVKMASNPHLGIVYELKNRKYNYEFDINSNGGDWFTTPEAAQAECNRRNAEKRGKNYEHTSK